MVPPSQDRILQMKRSARFRCRPLRKVPSINGVQDNALAELQIPLVQLASSVHDLFFVHDDVPMGGKKKKQNNLFLSI